jgi:hypothetical protein
MDADRPAEERDTDQKVSNFTTQVDHKAFTQNAFLPVHSVTYVFRTDVHEFSHTLLELLYKYSFWICFVLWHSVTYVFRADVHEFNHILLELFYKYLFWVCFITLHSVTYVFRTERERQTHRQTEKYSWIRIGKQHADKEYFKNVSKRM